MADYLVDVCPECKKVVNYSPNPEYLFIHSENKGGCGFKGYEKNLIQAVDIQAMEREKKNLQDRIRTMEKNAGELPHVIDNHLK